jgi:hypothetical protein
MVSRDSPQSKRPGREDDHSLLSSVEVNTGYRHMSTSIPPSPCVFMA